MLRLFLILPLLASCASTGNEGHIEKSPNEKIAEKRKLYCDFADDSLKEGISAHAELATVSDSGLRAIGCDQVLSQPAKLPRSENGRSKALFVPAQVKSWSKQFTFAAAIMGGAL